MSVIDINGVPLLSVFLLVSSPGCGSLELPLKSTQHPLRAQKTWIRDFWKKYLAHWLPILHADSAGPFALWHWGSGFERRKMTISEKRIKQFSSYNQTHPSFNSTNLPFSSIFCELSVLKIFQVKSTSFGDVKPMSPEVGEVKNGVNFSFSHLCCKPLEHAVVSCCFDGHAGLIIGFIDTVLCCTLILLFVALADFVSVPRRLAQIKLCIPQSNSRDQDGGSAALPWISSVSPAWHQKIQGMDGNNLLGFTEAWTKKSQFAVRCWLSGTCKQWIFMQTHVNFDMSYTWVQTFQRPSPRWGSTCRCTRDAAGGPYALHGWTPGAPAICAANWSIDLPEAMDAPAAYQDPFQGVPVKARYLFSCWDSESNCSREDPVSAPLIPEMNALREWEDSINSLNVDCWQNYV